MGFRVVCLSRTVAAGGEVVGQTVSQRLGFRYVDEEIITKASEKAHLDPQQMAELEHRKPLLKRLIASFFSGAVLPTPLTDLVGQPLPLDYYLHRGPTDPVVPAEFRSLIRAVIHEIADEGQVVIVAHAASMALADTPGVLRVLITASTPTRAERLVRAGQQPDVQQAEAALEESDRQRRDYIRLFYDISEELPTHYDLVINTDVLTPEQAASLILTAAQG